MKDYIAANKKAYEATASEFGQKMALREPGTTRVVRLLTDQLEKSHSDQPKTVLDIGPGSGQASKLFCDAGYEVTAIEFSEKMAALAQRTAPKAKVIVDEFTAHDFGRQTFDGIFAMAFIHLFPSEDVLAVMHKINSLLKPEGTVLISTTLHAEVGEGFMPKTNFSRSASRYRKQYTKPELLSLLQTTGFNIVKVSLSNDKEVVGKRWINVLANNTQE